MKRHYEFVTRNIDRPLTRQSIIARYCTGKRVLDLGCVQHDASNAKEATWLHGLIATVAAKTVGVDFAENEVARLKDLGYAVVMADITQPLPFSDKFDVIVVGNLIEHLSSFEGLMWNLKTHLEPNGCVLISTANPFYQDQYFYSAFKGEIIVNPEHTCWIDPITLHQLSLRFGFNTEEVLWVKEKWHLSQVIMNGPEKTFDMFLGRWVFSGGESAWEHLSGLLLSRMLGFFAPQKLRRITDIYGTRDAGRFLCLKVASYLFHIWWLAYRLIIVTSPINRAELFMSVLKISNRESQGC